MVCEQHPFGGVTYLYENATKEIQLESRYNELIGVQRETLDNLEEGIALLGSDGRMKLFNPAFARFWNFDPGFLENEPHIEELAAHGRRFAADTVAWDEVQLSASPGSMSNASRSSGKINAADRILQFTAVPLPDGNTLLTFADISDSSRMERALRDRADALEAADRLKNMFLSNVSYEIRTPLTSVLGFAEGLQMGLAGPLTAQAAGLCARHPQVLDRSQDHHRRHHRPDRHRCRRHGAASVARRCHRHAGGRCRETDAVDREPRPDAQYRSRCRCRELRCRCRCASSRSCPTC